MNIEGFRSIQCIYVLFFFPSFDLAYFRVGKAMALLEKGAKKALHLTGLNWSICIDEHNGLLNYYSLSGQEILVLCNHIKISNAQLVDVREVGQSRTGKSL